MKRILPVLLLLAACHKPAEEKPRGLPEAPPPPALQIPRRAENEEGGFRVVAGRPQGKLTGAARPTLTFSEPVVALETLEQQDPASRIQIQPPVKGKWRWLGSSSVEFVNEEPFPYSTAFHVVVPRGFKALDGAELEAPWQLDFTTPTVEVIAHEVTPQKYLCQWSVPDQRFEIVVNQPVAAPEKAFFFEAGEEKRMVKAKLVRSVSLEEERRQKEEAEKDPAKRRRYARLPSRDLALADLRTRYEIAPAQALPRDARFAFGLGGEARGTQGDLPAGVEWRQECRTMGPMRVARISHCDGGHCPRGPISIDFTNPLGPVAELRKRVHVTPDAQLEWDETVGEDLGVELQSNRTRAILFGKFKPGASYAVQIDAGVKDSMGQEAPAAQATVQMDDLLPSLYLGQEFALLEASGDGQLPAQVTNLTSLEADLWALTPEQLAPLELGPGPGRFPQRAPDAPLRLTPSYPKNEPHLHPIDLRAALGGRKTGLVAVRLRAPGTTFADHPLRALAQITDLAVHAKIGAASSLAWVAGVSSGKGVAGAKVSVYSRAGALLAEAVTDAQGLAALPGYGKLLPEVDYQGPRALVTAALGDDLGYAAVTGYSEESSPAGTSRNYQVVKQEPAGLVFADRGIYRPGDTVHVKGILRQRQMGELHTPAGAPVQVKVSDPQGNDVLSQQVTLTRYGTFSVDALVPKTARLGDFSIQASVPKGKGYAYGSFLVAEYRAPQFRVDVQVQKAELTAGDELQATVIARYLFGGALERARAEWSASRTTEDFTPPRNDGFRFGRSTWNWDDREPAHDSGLFAAGQGEIGHDGTLAVRAGKVEAPGDRAASYTLEAEVADVSRQRVAGRASVLVHPAAHYVGLGAGSLFAKAGEPLKLPVVAAAPGGDRVSAKVRVEALLRSWHAVRKRGVNGVYQTLSEPVEEKAAGCEVTTGKDPVECALVLQKPGFYNLRAESRDDAGRLALTTSGVYAVGGGFAAWQQGDTNRVEVVADKASYQVGETAHLLIKSPFQSCRALVTIEREGVSDGRVLALTGTAATVDVPITEEMAPNVYFGVVLVRERVADGAERGDDPGRPSVRLGYAPLKVGTPVKRLEVSVSAPKEEYRPREKVPVDVLVRDLRGDPQQAEVQLYAVDEAVLRLTAYALPDPVSALHPEHPLAVAGGEPLLRLVRRLQFGEKGEIQPGGGGGKGPSGDVRSRFATTVLWRTLETGADGKAHAEIELPDNLTTFRILAVAATDKDRFGAGQSQVRVSLPLLVLPALPRMARVGDEFEAGVAVHSLKQLEVKISAQVSGGVQLAEGAEKTITVEAGVAREVRFKLRGAAPGTATLRFRATAGDLTDAVEQAIPVQLPVELEAVAVAGDTSSTKTEGLVPPQGVRPGVGGLSLSLSSTALGGLGEGIRQLVDYPYGCLEQLASRLVPFVALREVQRVFGGSDDVFTGLTGRAAPDEVVRETVAKIEQLQTPSGGFLYWPGARCPYAWSSIYATLALHRAQQMDYPVHKDVLVRARKFLQATAAGEPVCRERPGPEARIFALQVLARMGEPRPTYYDELYAQKDKLPLFAKAQLADAVAVGKGKRSMAEALLRDLLDAARETPREVHFEEAGPGNPLFFTSDTRTTGMVLQTLVSLQPAHPFVGKIARYLTAVRKGGAYRNTQEAAYALMGLAEVVRVKERQAPDFVARVLLGGKELASAEFRKRSLQVVEKQVPMSELPSSGKPLPMEVKVDGTGTLYYTALLRYAPEELPKEPRNQGIFVQRWFEPYDQSGKQAAEFAAGDLVRVRVRVATPQERNFVAVEVPLPAGLEAVDTALAVSRQLPRERDEERPESEETEAASEENMWFWSPFTYSEKRDDRVVYFSDHLPPGVHVASFVARATTPGKFVLKPARAEEMYAPEVFGRTDSGTLSVVEQRPLAQR